MKIQRVYIKNFRSIKELDLEVNDLTALIGPNSSGKTNILKAIDLVLGERYPTERIFSKDDFFNRNSNDWITIHIYFSESIGNFRLTSKESKTKKSVNVCSLQLIHTKCEEASFNTVFTAFGPHNEEYYANNDVREAFSFIYMPSERNLDKQISVSQWSILGKILRKVDKEFRQNEQGVQEFETAMNNSKYILFNDNSFIQFQNHFINTCKEMSRGLADDFTLDLNLYDPLFFYKTIQIIAKENLGQFNTEELGSGMQNLILLSLFRTYAHIMKNNVILAIEEPEIYLYPQAQRSLYKNFIELSDNQNTQIFYTTHNPNFVDASRADDITLLRKSSDTGTYKLEKHPYFSTATATSDKYKLYTHFNPERNELFFANKVLLVEGASDKILFSTLCEEKWNIDIDEKGISIIECNGKNGVKYFLGICQLIGLKNYFAIWDSDNEDAHSDKNKNPLGKALDEKKGLELKPNLEKYLQLRENTNKIQQAHEWALNIELPMIPKEFEKVKNFLDPNGQHTDTKENETTTSENQTSSDTNQTFDQSQDEDDEINFDDIPF